MLQRKLAVNERAKVREVEGDGAGQRGFGQRRGHVQENPGLGHGQLAGAHRLARVFDADAVAPVRGLPRDPIASATVSPAVYLRETRVAISASTGEDMTRAFMPSSRANVRSVSAARSNS